MSKFMWIREGVFQFIDFENLISNFTFVTHQDALLYTDLLGIKFNLCDLNQRDIDQRSKILSTVLVHTDRFLKLMLSKGHFEKDKSFFVTDYLSILAINNENYPIGSWMAPVSIQGCSYRICYTDIIGMYAVTRRITYKNSIRELFSHIENNKYVYSSKSDNSTRFWQEKNPINLDEHYRNNFLLFTIKQIGTTYSYLNKSGKLIAEHVVFYNNNRELVSVFCLLVIKISSLKLFYITINQKPPYMFYILRYDPNFKFTVILKNYESNSNLYNDCNVLVHSMGYHNLHNADFSEIDHNKIYIELDQLYINLSFLLRLKERANIYKKEIYFYDTVDNSYKSLEETIKIYNFNSEIKKSEKEHSQFIPIPPGKDFPNQNKIRKKILEPIVESGTITWLFAQEKAGKTLIALSIAYMVSKGNLSLGNWRTGDPFNVLYVDGEMPGDKLGSFCDCVMRGFGETGDKIFRPFAAYLFRELSFDCSSILDEVWLEKSMHMFFSYDLIIFDNYYSLNDNNLNVKPFIAFLNKITRKDIAVIIVDHTNTSGELQGSIVKRRAMDLGIILNVIDSQTIDISYDYDRYGVTSNLNNTRLLKIFTSSQYEFRVTNQDNNIYEESLTEIEFYCLFSYIFSKDLKVKQVDISNLFDKDERRISEYVNSAVCFFKNTGEGKYKIKNTERFKTDYDEFKLFDYEDLLSRFLEMKIKFEKTSH